MQPHRRLRAFISNKNGPGWNFLSPAIQILVLKLEVPFAIIVTVSNIDEEDQEDPF